MGLANMYANELIYDYTGQRTGAIYRASDEKLLGSGVFISPQGHMLTCAHLQIPDPNQIYVRDANNRKLKVVSVEIYQDIDTSLLLCEKASYRFSFFTINTNLAQLNRDVLVFGFPDREHFQEGFGRTSTIVSQGSLRVGDFTIRVCGLEGTNVSEGMSGGPVVDLRTKALIGIILGFDKSLEKSIYNINRELFALQTQRLDDLFIPVDIIVDRIEKIRVVAMVNKNDEHLKLVNRVVGILDLLGFKSNLIDLENNQKYSIHSNVTVGFVSFEMLMFCFSQGDDIVTTSTIRKVSRNASNYANEVGRNIEKVCIVIENQINKETLTLAENSQIEILNADDLFNNLIDFSDYLELAIEQWREDRANIAQKYVDLKGKILVDSRFIAINSVEDFILDWIKNSDKSKLLVLGKYGSGKTTLSRRLFYVFAENYSQNKATERIPIFVRLRNTKSLSIRQLITDLMQNEFSVSHSNFGVFSKLNELGRLFMIFDGFDEMKQQGSYSASVNMRELSKYFKANSKVLITCRLEYFIENRDISTLMSLSEFDDLRTEENFEVIVLDDLDKEQIAAYLDNIAERKNGANMLSTISSIPNLIELAQRPVLLDMITQSLPDLMGRKEAVSIANLYQVYVNKWLDRDLIVGRTTIPKETKLKLMRSIAEAMNNQGSLSLDYEELLNIVKKFFTEDLGRSTFYLHDILTNSFLTRNDRNRIYEFSHKSFYEFFLAENFISDIRKLLASPTEYFCSFGKRRLAFEVFEFMKELGILENELWRLVERTKHRNFNEVKYLGGNAITCLRFLGADFRNRDFDDTVLAGAIFADLDLTNSTFRNANLFDTGFGNTITENVNMTGADLTQADFKSVRTIYTLDYSDKKRCIATGSTTKNVSLWFLNTFEEKDNLLGEKVILRGHTDFVHSVAFGPDDRLLASGSKDQSVRIWDVLTGEEIGILRGHLGDLRGLAFIDEHTLISCGTDGQVIKWDLTRKTAQQSVNLGEQFWGLDINKNKQLLVTGDLGGVVRLWNYNNLQVIHSFPVNRGQTRTVCFFSDDIVLAGCQDGSVFSWNFSENIWRTVYKQNAAIKALAVRNSDGLIASGADDGTIALWKGKDLDFQSTIVAHSDVIYEMKFSETAGEFFSTGPDGTIAIWKVDDNKLKLAHRFSETFENDHFNCKNLILTDVKGLSRVRIEHLKRNGAVE